MPSALTVLAILLAVAFLAGSLATPAPLLRLLGRSAAPASGRLSGVPKPLAQSKSPVPWTSRPAVSVSAGGPAAAGDDAERIILATWNIRHGRGLDGRVDLSRTADLLASLDADVIALQEVDRRLPRSGFVDQAGELASRLGYRAVFGATLGGQPAGYGNALLTRLPVLSTKMIRLPSRREPRGVLRVELDAGPAGSLFVYVVHLGLSARERIGHVAPILDFVRTSPGPLVLLGDLNSRPSELVIQAIAAELTDAYLAANPGPPAPTFGLGTPEPARIDYAFTGYGAEPERAWVVETDASDHAALLVQIALPVVIPTAPGEGLPAVEARPRR